ncbi:MAG: hypothetical protein P8H93_00195 [Polaribacter sp.]|nr:hypothetical protein [Polaribacter sp.]
MCYTHGQQGDENEPGPPPPPPPSLSIDGGLFFLIASATIYGLKKTRN